MYHAATTNTPDLLANWRWLLDATARLRGWSSSGDLYYSDSAGVWWLDAGAGTVERVADTIAGFDAILADQDRAEELLLLPVVRAFEAAHGRLQAGHCLGFRSLPALGGSYAVENRYSTTIAEHAAFTGEVHGQIRDLPDGSTVRIDLVP